MTLYEKLLLTPSKHLHGFKTFFVWNKHVDIETCFLHTGEIYST